jgi:hypothetical protein
MNGRTHAAMHGRFGDGCLARTRARFNLSLANQSNKLRNANAIARLPRREFGGRHLEFETGRHRRLRTTAAQCASHAPFMPTACPLWAKHSVPSATGRPLIAIPIATRGVFEGAAPLAYCVAGAVVDAGSIGGSASCANTSGGTTYANHNSINSDATHITQ